MPGQSPSYMCWFFIPIIPNLHDIVIVVKSCEIPYNQMNNPMKFRDSTIPCISWCSNAPWFFWQKSHLRFPLGRRLRVAAGLCGTYPQQPADRQRAVASPVDLLGTLQGHPRWLGNPGSMVFLNGKILEVNGWMFNIAIIPNYQRVWGKVESVHLYNLAIHPKLAILLGKICKRYTWF